MEKTNNYKKTNFSKNDKSFNKDFKKNKFEKGSFGNNSDSRKPKNDSFDKKPKTDRFDRQPKSDNFDRKPKTDRFDRQSKTDSYDRKPRTDRFDRQPRNDNFDRKPMKQNFENREPDEDDDDLNGFVPNRKNIFNEGLQLEGRNAVLEALNSDRDIDKIWVKKGEIEGTLRVIKAKAYERNIVLQEVSIHKLDEIAMTHNHQGVIAMCPAKEYCTVDDILDKAKANNEPPFIVILDGVTDTHNLGAIIRSANCAGVHGIIIPKRRAAGLTGIVSKTSAGAIEHVLIAKVTNIKNTVTELQEKGVWIYTADMEGQPVYKTDFKGAVGLVLGDESEGVSQIVQKASDFKVQIPMYGEISSLNVSVAGSVLMYEVVRQRKFN